MAIELKVPAVGESVTEVQLGEWFKREGDLVERDEAVVVIDTDKVSVDLAAPVRGRIERILVASGQSAQVGDVVGLLEPIESAPAADDASTAASSPSPRPLSDAIEAVDVATALKSSEPPRTGADAPPANAEPWPSPAARRALAEHGLNPADLREAEHSGRLTRRDVEEHLRQKGVAIDDTRPFLPPEAGQSEEEAVPMSPFRRTIAERLVASQHQAALLTTFNEIDMSGVQALRAEVQEEFRAKHGVKLGLMSFFVRAVVEALKAVPVVNAEIRGSDIVYKNHYDIGIAVGSGRGLVVPVLRRAERMGFSVIEKAIADFAARARDNRLRLEELSGGTFTISNGGIYGSMLSTPIVNPPQSGILGLHAINERPVAERGAVVVRPMMYVALTYDHRIVDGREAVTFLGLVKRFVERPVRVLLEL